MDAEQLRRKEFSRILIIKLSALGDVIHTVPVLHKLRRRYPSARIDWLTSPAMAELLRPHLAISNVIEIARNEWLLPWRWSSYTSAARVAARLASMHYDLVIDMHGQLRTAFLTLAAKAPVRIGFDRPEIERQPPAMVAVPRFAPQFQRARLGEDDAQGNRQADPT